MVAVALPQRAVATALASTEEQHLETFNPIKLVVVEALEVMVSTELLAHREPVALEWLPPFLAPTLFMVAVVEDQPTEPLVALLGTLAWLSLPELVDPEAVAQVQGFPQLAIQLLVPQALQTQVEVEAVVQIIEIPAHVQSQQVAKVVRV
jgi:hypothetical protein